MAKRVQVILEEEEREEFRERANREGVSLSAWLRQAGREKLTAAKSTKVMTCLEELRSFFAACDDREEGVEPDWKDHKAVIDRSARSGETGT